MAWLRRRWEYAACGCRWREHRGQLIIRPHTPGCETAMMLAGHTRAWNGAGD